MNGADRSELVEFREEFNKRMDKQDAKLDRMDTRVQAVEIAKGVAEELLTRQQHLDRNILTQRQIKWGGIGIGVALLTALANLLLAHGAAIAALAVILL